MEAMLVTPRDDRQQSVLADLFREMRVSFVPIERKIREEDVFYPELDDLSAQTGKDMKAGRLVKLNTDNMDEFWKQVEGHEL